MTPIVFFTVAMRRLLIVLGMTIGAVTVAGPWALAITIPLIFLLFFILLSVVRLVRSHPEGLMGFTPRQRPRRRRSTVL